MLQDSRSRQLLAGRILHVTGLLTAALITTACGSSVGSGGSGEEQAATGAEGAEGSGQRCTQTDEYSKLTVTLPDGKQLWCAPDLKPGVNEESEIVEGVVHNEPDGTIVIDSCAPNADCVPTKTVLSVSSSGPDALMPLSIPDGTFVQLTSHSTSVGPGGLWPMCSIRTVIRNLPTWGGASNPTSNGVFFWLAEHFSTNGDNYALPDDPYLVEQEIACTIEESPDPNSPLFAWRFSSPDAPGAEVIAYMGETVTWSIPEGELAGEYQVRNLHATAHFGHAEFRYWVVRK